MLSNTDDLNKKQINIEQFNKCSDYLYDFKIVDKKLIFDEIIIIGFINNHKSLVTNKLFEKIIQSFFLKNNEIDKYCEDITNLIRQSILEMKNDENKYPNIFTSKMIDDVNFKNHFINNAVDYYYQKYEIIREKNKTSEYLDVYLNFIDNNRKLYLILIRITYLYEFYYKNNIDLERSTIIRGKISLEKIGYKDIDCEIDTAIIEDNKLLIIEIKNMNINNKLDKIYTQIIRSASLIQKIENIKECNMIVIGFDIDIKKLFIHTRNFNNNDNIIGNELLNYNVSQRTKKYNEMKKQLILPDWIVDEFYMDI